MEKASKIRQGKAKLSRPFNFSGLCLFFFPLYIFLLREIKYSCIITVNDIITFYCILLFFDSMVSFITEKSYTHLKFTIRVLRYTFFCLLYTKANKENHNNITNNKYTDVCKFKGELVKSWFNQVNLRCSYLNFVFTLIIEKHVNLHLTNLPFML